MWQSESLCFGFLDARRLGHRKTAASLSVLPTIEVSRPLKTTTTVKRKRKASAIRWYLEMA
jgi:hypothetical protein